MRVSSIKFNIGYINNRNFRVAFGNTNPVDKTPATDTFEKTTTSVVESSITPPVEAVQQTGRVQYSNYDFEYKFGRQFFRKLAAEGIIDPYDGKTLIPTQEVETLKSLGVLNKKAPIAVKFLKDYKDSMYPIEKEVFGILEHLAKKHPDKNIQELLQMKYDKAEKTLIKQQTIVLDKIGMIARKLPRPEFTATRKLINTAFDQMMIPDPGIEERFSRKRFLAALRELPISDENVKQKLYKIASDLPTSDKSINAFIVKYSQTEKLVTNRVSKKTTKKTRTAEELGLRLIEPSLCTDDHIYPQKLYREEENARLAGDANAMNLSKLRVTIPSTRRMNGEKSDILLDDFIEEKGYEPVFHTGNAIDRLCTIADIWADQKKYKDAVLLVEYIELLKEEYARRSNIINVDLTPHEKNFAKIRAEAEKYEESIKQKRLKKCGHADNSHKEAYMDKNGNQVKNRKNQKHGARFEPSK